MTARNVLGLAARAVVAGAGVLALTGCVSAVPRPYSPLPPAAGYYAPALPGYRPVPHIAVAPRVVYPPSYAPEPYRLQPAAVKPADPPAAAEPTPLRPVDPVGQYPVDDSCIGYWRICHVF
ncbi:MAG: hypothetical protein B7Z80_08635 [Rhodospirillales bacterium 20-64-7]|nr:MAG: hypothetical protein B7Z80_08635 [Rhodospirillales bacterium 20-64-7]